MAVYNKIRYGKYKDTLYSFKDTLLRNHYVITYDVKPMGVNDLQIVKALKYKLPIIHVEEIGFFEKRKTG